MTSLDFSDAYFHILVHNRFCKFLLPFISKTKLFSSGPFLLASQQLLWYSLSWSRKSRIPQYLDDEGWGAHLGDFTASRSWSLPESRLHINFLELKAILLALKRFRHVLQNQVVLVATDNTTVVAYINKEGRYEVRLTLCPSLAPPVLVQSETYCPEGQAHPRPSECDYRQAVPTRSDNPDGMVPSSGSIRPSVPNQAQTTGRHVCYQVQTDQVHVSSPGPECLGSGCSISLLGGSGHVCISPVSLLGKVISKLAHLCQRV